MLVRDAPAEGKAILRWLPIAQLAEDCLADAGVVETAVQQGGSVDVANIEGWTSLHFAAMMSSDRLMAALLDAGAHYCTA